MKTREINCSIKGIHAWMMKDAFILEGDQPIRTLSSAVLNGGLVDAGSLMNLHVLRSFKGSPHSVLLERIRSLGLRTPTVGLMTAVDMRRLAVSTQCLGGKVIVAYVTAGVSHPAAAGDQVMRHCEAKVGTINIILLIDGNLTDSCLVNAVQTAVEAKTVALRRFNVKSRFSESTATGTITDAVAVASTRRGREIFYAGTATPLGLAIANVVMEGIEKSLQPGSLKSKRHQD